jgi:hypothetical protein
MNTQPTAVVQGARTTNEMCMLIGSYYPRDPRTSNCQDELGNLGGEWVGNGVSTCSQSWDCVTAAVSGGDAVAALGPCVQNADPVVAPELSAAIRCVARTQGFAMCGPEIAACQAK